MPRVASIESLKFLAPLRPGDPFRMNVQLGGDAKLRVRAWQEEERLLEGRVQLASAQPGDST